ncbi:hypothetical protein [Paraburkholderia tagetis]|uniref:PAAR motif-containing protein n=1 Tax=Paraburkholderia tagetis TaxID=2913261 RepID=A0A9X1UDF4_9BURK|nr:hypothetical protein [Paraburkholderia tagetis]MCG5071980.1 hypothetical protein [Paraburkholderia tagetis]
MVGIYYAAVEDDPLTSGPGSHVYASKRCATIQGEDGKRRRLAFIGDKAYCSRCDSVGLITYGAGLNERRRLNDLANGGRRQAVGDDIVLCKCAEPPRIIAVYGRDWKIHDRGEENTASFTKTPAQSAVYNEKFVVKDSGGSPLANVRYRVRIGESVVAEGTTNAYGHVSRITTDAAQRLIFEVAQHHEGT